MRPHAREVAGKCSTRPRAGRPGGALAADRAVTIGAGSIGAGSPFARADVGSGEAAHQALDELGRKAAPEQEARLRRSLRRAGGQGGEAALANGRGTIDLGRGERRRELGRQRDRMLRELAADALNAEALGTRMHARLGEARIGKKAIRLEPVEQRVDLGHEGARVGVGGRIGFSAARVTQELPAQLEPALVALREQLQGARLERALHDYTAQRPPGRPKGVAAPSGGSERREAPAGVISP